MINIKDSINNQGSNVYYNSAFRNMIEDHIPIFKTDPNTEKIIVTPQQMYRYEYDLYGLLMELKYERQYHWIILRTNDLYNYSDFTKTNSILLIPEITKVQNLMRIFKSREHFI